MNLRKDHSHAVRFLSLLISPSGCLPSTPLEPRQKWRGHTISLRLYLFVGLAALNLKLVFFAAMNVLARVTTKDVANCDTHCELRSSGNQQKVERKRRLGLPRGVSGSVFKIFYGARSMIGRASGLRAHGTQWRGRVKFMRLSLSGCLHSGLFRPLGMRQGGPRPRAGRVVCEPLHL